MEKYTLGQVKTQIKTLLSSGVAAVLISCSGGGGGGSVAPAAVPDTTPPQITARTPAEGAVDVAIDNVISATFDEPLLSSSIDTSSITLDENGTQITGTVSEDATSNSIIFTPDTTLDWLTTYTVVVNNTITDLAGNPLDASLTWDFTTISDAVSPAIISTTPVDGESDVPRDQAISAEFDEDILITSVDDSSFFLRDADDNPVDGVLEFGAMSNRIVNFIPDEELPKLATYTASATTAITDLSGNGLGADYDWQFTTSDGTWNTAELIESDDLGDANKPRISMNASGVAFAVWHQNDGVRYNIWSSRYTPNSGWEDPVIIDEEDLGDARDPQIFLGRLGTAIAVWHQNDGTRSSIWSNRYNPLLRIWETAELIESDNGVGAFYPDVSIASDGTAFAVWEQYDGSYYSIMSNRYTPGTGWDTEEEIETESLGHASSPKVSADADGNAIAVWYQNDGSLENIWSNRYTPTSGWGTAELIEVENAGDATSPRISIESNGNAIAVWEQVDGTRSDIWANRYTPANGWEGAELIESDDLEDATRANVSIDINGNAMAVWVLDDGFSDNDIWSSRFIPASGWSNAEMVETDELGTAYGPQIVTDPNGNALAVWANFDSIKNDIWSNRYIEGTGWGSPELIESNDPDNAFIDPSIGMDADGNAIAVWPQNDGTQYDIWSNRFD